MKGAVFPAVMTLRLPEHMPEEIKDAAAIKRTTSSEFVRQALRVALEEARSVPMGRRYMAG